MRIQQLRELLDYIAECRLDMAKMYHRLHNQADSSRAKLVLEYFEKHQKDVAQHLEDYIDAAPSKILDAWYKDFVFEDFKKRCQDVMLPANMSEDDVLELHLELDNALIALLEKTAASSSSAEVKSALEDLVRVEKIHQHRLVHSTIRMEDI
ncbi:MULTISPECIES: hypothetical protein [Shewanella]|jgi:hypothetical protein|uniref:Rubrerythrin n=1 Tax=Shewanella fodinae TaxID=552357 RepID=A0A4R2FGE4_9GAMM|nr:MULTISPECIES: hypothetical protein [Shewanella]MDN5370363.1 hypothetical protein [Shewanella sp.]MBO1271566.1 hypothetical protein [Shewanella sp. 4t3-1-2LB]MCL2906926.1 hypothetical protein [Shewanella fodinae]TCN89023.1 hypothetical protein EDC91_103204 [Shewanella fodinae]GGZ05570.1 hypothetical protein GCM10007169_22810 [Shewanella fodinae]